MEKLVISRKVWLRGEGGPASSLYRPTDGKMCCLGIYLLDKGVEKVELWRQPTPWSIRTNPKVPAWLLREDKQDNSPIVKQLMTANDGEEIKPDEPYDERDEPGDPLYTPADEGLITALFASVGVEVTFVD